MLKWMIWLNATTADGTHQTKSKFQAVVKLIEIKTFHPACKSKQTSQMGKGPDPSLVPYAFTI